MSFTHPVSASAPAFSAPPLSAKTARTEEAEKKAAAAEQLIYDKQHPRQKVVKPVVLRTVWRDQVVELLKHSDLKITPDELDDPSFMESLSNISTLLVRLPTLLSKKGMEKHLADFAYLFSKLKTSAQSNFLKILLEFHTKRCDDKVKLAAFEFFLKFVTENAFTPTLLKQVKIDKKPNIQFRVKLASRTTDALASLFPFCANGIVNYTTFFRSCQKGTEFTTALVKRELGGRRAVLQKADASRASVDIVHRMATAVIPDLRRMLFYLTRTIVQINDKFKEVDCAKPDVMRKIIRLMPLMRHCWNEVDTLCNRAIKTITMFDAGFALISGTNPLSGMGLNHLKATCLMCTENMWNIDLFINIFNELETVFSPPELKAKLRRRFDILMELRKEDLDEEQRGGLSKEVERLTEWIVHFDSTMNIPLAINVFASIFLAYGYEQGIMKRLRWDPRIAAVLENDGAARALIQKFVQVVESGVPKAKRMATEAMFENFLQLTQDEPFSRYVTEKQAAKFDEFPRFELAGIITEESVSGHDEFEVSKFINQTIELLKEKKAEEEKEFFSSKENYEKVLAELRTICASKSVIFDPQVARTTIGVADFLHGIVEANTSFLFLTMVLKKIKMPEIAEDAVTRADAYYRSLVVEETAQDAEIEESEEKEKAEKEKGVIQRAAGSTKPLVRKKSHFDTNLGALFFNFNNQMRALLGSGSNSAAFGDFVSKPNSTMLKHRHHLRANEHVLHALELYRNATSPERKITLIKTIHFWLYMSAEQLMEGFTAKKDADDMRSLRFYLNKIGLKLEKRNLLVEHADEAAGYFRHTHCFPPKATFAMECMVTPTAETITKFEQLLPVLLKDFFHLEAAVLKQRKYAEANVVAQFANQVDSAFEADVKQNIAAAEESQKELALVEIAEKMKMQSARLQQKIALERDAEARICFRNALMQLQLFNEHIHLFKQYPQQRFWRFHFNNMLISIQHFAKHMRNGLGAEKLTLKGSQRIFDHLIRVEKGPECPDQHFVLKDPVNISPYMHFMNSLAVLSHEATVVGGGAVAPSVTIEDFKGRIFEFIELADELTKI